MNRHCTGSFWSQNWLKIWGCLNVPYLAPTSDVVGTRVKLHREVIDLAPVHLSLVSCMATGEGLVPRIHNTLAEPTVSGSYLINSQLFSREDLLNVTIVNSQLYPLSMEDKLLDIFHHFSNHSALFIQCLEKSTFNLNDKDVRCEVLDFFLLPEDFVLVANGKYLRSQKLVQRKHAVQVAWMTDYEFSNIDKTALPEIQSFTVLHPALEKFFFTEAGEINIHHAGYVGSTLFVVIASIFACCCRKNLAFRQFFLSKASFLMNYIYNLFTTETYRLRKETEKLDEEIGEKWDELKKMESLIAKKEELRRKLPDNSNHEPSAPQQSSVQVPCEVHPQPPPARPSSHPSSSTFRGK